MADILEDERIKWIRQRTVLALDIPTETFDEYFKETLERARSAGIARDNLKNYISDKELITLREWRESPSTWKV